MTTEIAAAQRLAEECPRRASKEAHAHGDFVHVFWSWRVGRGLADRLSCVDGAVFRSRPELKNECETSFWQKTLDAERGRC